MLPLRLRALLDSPEVYRKCPSGHRLLPTRDGSPLGLGLERECRFGSACTFSVLSVLMSQVLRPVSCEESRGCRDACCPWSTPDLLLEA